MERFKKYLLVTLGFACAGAIGVVCTSGTVQAVVASLVNVVNLPLAAGAASNVVTVWCAGTTGNCNLNGSGGSSVEVLSPDGTQGGPIAGGLAIPAGKVLVITSVSIRTCASPVPSPNQAEVNFGNQTTIVAGSLGAYPITTASSCFTGNYTFPTGVVVRTPLNASFPFSLNGNGNFTEGAVNGFFAPDN